METKKTNKGEYNAIIKEAEKINAQLLKLQKKAEQLADRCREFADRDYDTFICELSNLAQVADDFANFDLEDSIPERARFNF